MRKEKSRFSFILQGKTTFHVLHERAGIRTPDNLIKSQVLYRLSYTPIFFCNLLLKKTGLVGFEPT